MVAAVVVVCHEGLDLILQIARRVVALQQDAVFQRLVLALDLAPGHRVIRSPADKSALRLERRDEQGQAEAE